MRILKRHPLLKIVNSYVIDSPQPSNISYLWNFGSLLGLCLVIQIVTGVTLAMHYNPSVLEAFNSIEHIMRDVNNGWLIRYLHSNTASAFFFLVYLHIGRNLYYGSYKAPRTLAFTIGVIILIAMMATGFLGYWHSPKWDTFFFNILPFFIEIINSINIDNQITLSATMVVTSNNNLLKTFLEEYKLNPTYIYNDLHLDETRKIINNDTKNLSGIYLIFNKVTGDYYIGSASTNKLYSRFSRHLIYLVGSKIVKNVVKKYKLNNFVFVILELFPEIVNKENNKKLLDLEDFYLKSLLPNYNILTEAGSNFGYKHTEISRIKMKSSISLESRLKRADNIRNLNKGKEFSPETIEKMKVSALNRKKHIYSEEILLNMKKNSKVLIVYNLDYTVFGEYSSIIEVTKATNSSISTIQRTLKTPKKILKRRFIIKLKDENVKK